MKKLIRSVELVGIASLLVEDLTILINRGS